MLKIFKTRNQLVPVVQKEVTVVPKEEEKKFALFFDEDLDMNKSLFSFCKDTKINITNKETIIDEIIDDNINLQNIMIHNNDKDTFKAVQYSNTLSYVIKQKTDIELRQALYSVVESNITPLFYDMDRPDLTTKFIADHIFSNVGLLNSSMSDTSLAIVTNDYVAKISMGLEKSLMEIIYNLDIDVARKFIYNKNPDQVSSENLLDSMYRTILPVVKDAMLIYKPLVFAIILKNSPLYKEAVDAEKESYKLFNNSKSRYGDDCEEY